MPDPRPLCALALGLSAVSCGPTLKVDFDDLSEITTPPPASAPIAVGDRFFVGQELVVGEEDARLIVLPFQWGGSSSSPGCPPGWSAGGFVEVEASTRAGGTGNELHFNNASLGVTSTKRSKVTDLKAKFADLGGNINLAAGGALRSDGDFEQIPSPIPLSAPPVAITVTPPRTQGTLHLTGDLNQFSYPFPCPPGLAVADYWVALGGGQELWMDDLELELEPPDPQHLRPDDTVSAEHVRDQAAPSQAALHALVDEPTADDTDWLVAGGGMPGTVVLSLDQMAPPYTDTNWALRTRYRISGHATGTWKLEASLLESSGATVLWGPVLLASGTTDTLGWVLDEERFTGNVSWDRNPSVRYQITTAAPNQVVRASGESNPDSWRDESGDPATAFTSLGAGDSGWVRSPVVGTTGSTVYEIDLTAADPMLFLDASRTGVVHVRWKKPQDGIGVTVALLQGTAQIASWNLGSAAQPDFITSALDLTAGEWNALTDFADLHLRWTLTGGAGAKRTAVVPIADRSVGEAWTNDGGGTTDLFLDIDDTGDANEITGTTRAIPYDTNPKREVEVQLGEYVFPGVSTGHELVFEGRASADFPVGPGNLEIELWAGSQQVMTQSQAVASATYTRYEYPLSASQVSQLQADPTSLWVRLRVQSSSGTPASHKIDFVHLETPEPARLTLSDAWLELPPAAFGGVSWVELEVP